MSTSSQQKLGRIRRPRVQITYDVETHGSTRVIELPFIVGVLADLSGMPATPPRPIKDRKAVVIDRDNFNEVLAKMEPRLALRVPNKLTGDGASKLAVELKFKTLDDFDPDRVAEQIPPLKELLDVRDKLTQLLSKMEGNDQLEDLLAKVLNNSTLAQSVKAKMDASPNGHDGHNGHHAHAAPAAEPDTTPTTPAEG